MDTDLESHIPQEAAKYNGMIAVRELFMTDAEIGGGTHAHVGLV